MIYIPSSFISSFCQLDTKVGTFLGSYALHPLTHAPIQIWISDYVLSGYGTGAIMAVPAHDTRDLEFALENSLTVTPVVLPRDEIASQAECPRPYTGEGVLTNCPQRYEAWNGLSSEEAKGKILQELIQLGRGQSKETYRLRDWVFSRQRYWGEPIPIYFPVEMAHGQHQDPRRGDAHTIRYDCPIPVSSEELPLRLPDMDDFSPKEEGDPQGCLARAVEWRYFQRDGRWYARETNTMPQVTLCFINHPCTPLL